MPRTTTGLTTTAPPSPKAALFVQQPRFCARHHQMLHLGIGEAKVLDGRLFVRLPAWIDSEQRWTRNTLHQAHEAASRIGQQLALSLHRPNADPWDDVRRTRTSGGSTRKDPAA